MREERGREKKVNNWKRRGPKEKRKRGKMGERGKRRESKRG